MKVRNRKTLGFAIIAAFMLVHATLLAACEYNGHRPPVEINMGGHGAHHHEESGYTPQNSISCVDLKEAPSEAPVKHYELKASTASFKLANGKSVNAWTFNGMTPGPELRVQEGDRVVVQLHNLDIEDGVTVHWHGVVLPCSQDGVPGVTQNAVWPGEHFTYEFIARQPGTYWYHSHQQSSKQTKMGLLGRLIVEPKEPTTFEYDRDYAVTLQMLDKKHVLTNGVEGGVQLEAEPGELVRLRLINSHNLTQWMGVAGAEFQVVSIDGQDLNEPDWIREQWILVGGGQRYDLLVRMPEQGQVSVYSWKEERWQVSLGTGQPPGKLSSKAPWFDFTTYGKPLDDGVSIDMAFDQSHSLVLGPVDINGKHHHHIEPIVVKEGEWIKLHFKHRQGSDHPMHLHGHHFKVLTKNGKPLTGSPIWVDSITLRKGEEYEVAFQANNPGLWMLHCHNLDHAAAGMGMMVNYVGVTTPYRVGTRSGNLPD